MTKLMLMIFILILVFPFVAYSGGLQIYGTFYLDPQKKLGKEVELELHCSGDKPKTDFTDENGSFRLFNLSRTRECEIKVFYNNVWSEPYGVYFSSKPRRYDLIIEKSMNSEGNTIYILIRR